MIERLLAFIGNVTSVAGRLLWIARNHHPMITLGLFREHAIAWFLAWWNRDSVNVINEDELVAQKKGGRVFIFGCGASLNSITPLEWEKIRQFDSIGFNHAYYLNYPFTYYIMRGGVYGASETFNWRNFTDHILHDIQKDSTLDKAIFFVQKGFTSIFCNRIVGFKLWKKTHRVRFFYCDKVLRLPLLSTTKHLVHRVGTLCTAIDLAASLGYKEIVLIGVDLYDNRYFFLPPDKTIGWSDEEGRLIPVDLSVHDDVTLNIDDAHNTARNGVVEIVGEWNDYLRKAGGISISVYNPKSLLAKKIPVFNW